MQCLKISCGALLIIVTQACTQTVTLHLEPEILSVEQKTALLDADLVFLGEQHDNPFHHQLQEEIVELLGQNGRLGAVVFEQLNWTQQGLADNLTNRSLGQMPEDLHWDKSGWPPFALYEPIFKVAIRYKAAIIAGSITTEQSKAVYKSGYSAVFSPAEQQQLRLDKDLPEAALKSLQQEIFEGHCQMIPDDHVQTMIPIQRSRDAAMSLAWLKNRPLQPATVFIVGAGHARRDFGIPWYVQQIKPELKIWTVGMREQDSDPVPAGIYDQVIITAAAARVDPCAELQKKLKKP